MKITCQLQWTDYLESSLLHLQPTGLSRILLYIVVVFFSCGMIGFLYLLITENIGSEFLIGGVIFLAFLALYRYVLLPYRVKKIFFQQRELALPFELEFTDDAMIATNELGNSTRPWKNFVKWKENKELLLLYHSDVLYSMIPKRFLAGPQEIESVKTYLVSNKIPLAKSRAIAAGCAIYILLWILMIVLIVYVGYRNTLP